MAIKGFGYMAWIATDGKLFLGRPNQITVQSDLQSNTIQGYPFANPSGLLQDVDSYATSETYTATMQTASVDIPELQRTLDQLTTTEATIVLPEVKEYTANGTGVVTVTGLVANQQCGVFFQDDQNAKVLTQVASAPTADQFSVTANTITLNAARANQKVVISAFKSFSTVQALGVQDVPLGDLAFVGRLIGTRFATAPLMYIPRMTRISGINLGGDNISTQYKCVLKAGFAKPLVLAFGVPVP